MGNKIQRIYVGSNQIYPCVYCDFTQSDCGFVYYGQSGTLTNHGGHGRGSNGLYTYFNSSGEAGAAGWTVPSSIYSKGDLKKVEFTVRANKSGNVLTIGLTTGVDTNRFRFVWNLLQARRPSTTTATTVSTTTINADTDYIYTLDIENATMYMTNSSTTLTIPTAQINSFYTDWRAGNVNLALGTNTQNISTGCYCYVKKAKFYF